MTENDLCEATANRRRNGPIRPLAMVLLVLVPIGGMGQNAAGADGAQEEDLQLTLPKVWYAVPNVPMSLYFDNIVLTQTPENYTFSVECDIGRTEKRRWTATPKKKDVGDHVLRITVENTRGKKLAKGRFTLRILPQNAGEGKKLKLLIVGDSLTAVSVYPDEIARLLSKPGNPDWVMFGRNKRGKVRHEGFGGWTWKRFNTAHVVKPTRPGLKYGSSPFVFADSKGKPQLDVARYLKEHCGGEAPDVITFLLGINDCFGANPKASDKRIDQVLKEAEKLLGAFRKAAPKAALAVCLTPAPNSREEAFQANYNGRYPRWGWKCIQHHLVQRMMKNFYGREKDGIHVIPAELNIDPIDGYPEDNSVHPNKDGYAQIGASMYCWLKWWLENKHR